MLYCKQVPVKDLQFTPSHVNKKGPGILHLSITVHVHTVNPGHMGMTAHPKPPVLQPALSVGNSEGER